VERRWKDELEYNKSKKHGKWRKNRMVEKHSNAEGLQKISKKNCAQNGERIERIGVKNK
jgi:hypothetical protein